MSFERYHLDGRILAGIRSAGYVEPTRIQEEALPHVLAGRDVLGLAQTGTGKTAAFALPILQRLLAGPRRRIRALVVAPTRELAEQIHQEVSLLGARTGLRSATVYGGVGFAKQEAALRGDAEIVVACPGRFLDHVGRGNVDLSAVEVLVLDEADHMLDMGFLPDVRRIMAHVPAGAQRLLFSATMPEALRGLVSDVLRDPVTVEVGRRAPASTVEQALFPVQRKDKTELLKRVLREHDPSSALVFTRTKHGAKKLAAQLEKHDHFVAAIQGNLSQNRRQQALDGFREGRYQILVATDIAARGIDVSGVSHVINYDMPDTVEAYIHRIGRTGRMERSGQAFSFVTPDDADMVRAIERRLGRPIRRVRVQGFDPGTAASAEPQGASGRDESAPPTEPSSRRRRSRRRSPRGTAGQPQAASRAGTARAPTQASTARAATTQRAQPARSGGDGDEPASAGTGRRRRRRRRRSGRSRGAETAPGGGDRNS